MNAPKLKKPSLKLPSVSRAKSGNPKAAAAGLKPPKLVADLYADLRERRLLPLVALLAVAIVAAPFLLADDDSPQPVPQVAAPPPAKAAAASFSVVPAEEQLREYSKRLQHRKRESPFSTYAAVRASNETREAVEGAIDSTEEGSVETGGAEAPVASEPAPEVVPVQPPAVEETTVKATIGFAAALRTAFVGSEPKVAAVEPQTRLPKPERPVVIYTGPSKDKKGALFLMSTDVSAYYGSGKCVLGGEFCQMLELRQGKSATFAVGYGETRYKLTFLGFVPIIEEETFQRGR